MANKFTPYARGLMVDAFPSQVFLSVHDDDPAEAGLNEVPGVDRIEINLDPADGNQIRAAAETQVDFEIPGGESVSHIGVFDSATDGDFLSRAELDEEQVYTATGLLRLNNVAIDLNVDCSPGQTNDHTEEAQNTMVAALPSTVYVSLHDGDPGDTGENETALDRISTTLGTATEGGRAADSEVIDFEVPETTTITHIGVFDADTEGNFIGAQPLDPEAEFTSAGVLRVVNLAFSLGLECDVQT